MVRLRRLLDTEDSESIDEKPLSNGDVYIGSFKGSLPHGKGKYIWSDRTVYEGDWEEGKITGKGQILWSSGATYEGDFSGGYLHGIGTFTGLDGSEYRGAWRMNIQHGLGMKRYSNLDVYEGSWKEGMNEGCGRYSWNSGNMYIGNWKGGKMCGRGVMKWENGDVFDGFWLNGLRHGSGVYRFSDGGYYFGMWSMGLKDGKGTFHPAGTKHPSLRKWGSSIGCDGIGRNLLSHSSSINSEEVRVPKPNVLGSLSRKMSISKIFKDPVRLSQRNALLDEKWSLCNPSGEFIYREPSCMLSQTSEEGQSGVQNNSTVVYEREYLQGVLKNEKVRGTELSQKTKQRKKFHVKEAKRKSCVDISEGQRSYYLMLNLQLGIRYTVGKITPVPMREVRDSDFGDRARIRMYFPRKGSQFTPPHYSIDFYWKDYCPMDLEDMAEAQFKMNKEMITVSLTIYEYEFPVSYDLHVKVQNVVPGISGYTNRNLREMFKLDAADYMMSICGDDGLRELSSPGKSGSIFYLSHDDRFVIKTLKKFELKLSNIHENMSFHDVALGALFANILVGLSICVAHRCHDTRQLSLDCSFLESQQIIDYSLLLGLHFRAPEQLRSILEPPATMLNDAGLPADGINSQGHLSIPPKGLLLVTHEPGFVSTAPGPHIRGNTLKAYSLGEREVDLLLPGTGRLRVQLGVNMPAQASHKLTRDEVDSAEIELFEVYDVVLYMGVIDILQEYNVKKKVEHACKSLKFDPLSISAVEPKLYAKRFLNFLHKVFPEQP
ncbi:hypothetical protein POTOM_001669 [Populus tomentosa]|uniref:Phosphatidylinositol 4-phosphate 5-kinase n=1 Tax=Populus tomentosa TaxID=118781 RepID=A0A8X8DID6_POPTO|nr:hypothetical protein POTOM_001669 [Populus tomentosa]